MIFGMDSKQSYLVEATQDKFLCMILVWTINNLIFYNQISVYDFSVDSKQSYLV